MDNSKKWYTSKTVIFNVVSGLVAIAASMQGGTEIPPNAQTAFASVVTVGNIVLRFLTSQPITAKPAETK